MKVIYKYTLEVTDEQEVKMPAGAQILCVQVQHGRPTLWALVDPEKKLEDRRFFVHGTGNPIHSDAKVKCYIGTVQINGFVWHVFEM